MFRRRRVVYERGIKRVSLPRASLAQVYERTPLTSGTFPWLHPCKGVISPGRQMSHVENATTSNAQNAPADGNRYGIYVSSRRYSKKYRSGHADGAVSTV